MFKHALLIHGSLEISTCIEMKKWPSLQSKRRKEFKIFIETLEMPIHWTKILYNMNTSYPQGVTLKDKLIKLGSKEPGLNPNKMLADHLQIHLQHSNLQNRHLSFLMPLKNLTHPQESHWLCLKLQLAKNIKNRITINFTISRSISTDTLTWSNERLNWRGHKIQDLKLWTTLLRIWINLHTLPKSIPWFHIWTTWSNPKRLVIHPRRLEEHQDSCSRSHSTERKILETQGMIISKWIQWSKICTSELMAKSLDQIIRLMLPWWKAC